MSRRAIGHHNVLAVFRRASRLVVSSVFAYSALVLSGCAKEEQPADRTLVLTIAHSTELRSYLAKMRDAFHAQNPTLPDGRKIAVELASKMSLQASASIAEGELKVHGWIAPSQAMVEYTNSQLINLGARQVDCRILFTSPIVFAVPRDRLQSFGVEGQQASWEAFSERFLVAGKPAGTESASRGFKIMHTTPKLSSTGFAALLQLANLASKTSGDQFLIQLLNPQAMDRLKRYEQAISSYGMSESDLLGQSADPGRSPARLTITTEQQLALFNLYRNEKPSRLVAVYSKEPSHTEQYGLCTSQAGWTTVGHVAALNIFGRYLLTGDAQLAARAEGFRPVLGDLPAGDPLTPAFGVDTSLPTRTLLRADGQVVDTLIQSWREVMRPSAILLVLDTSGSMDSGDRLRTAKHYLRTLLADTPSRDLRGLLTFSSETRLAAEPTQEIQKVLGMLDRSVAHGGSAIYDAVDRAVTVMSEPKFEPYRRSIIFVTDGQDKNSLKPLPTVAASIERLAALHDINLFIVALQGDSPDFSDLKKLAEAAHGRFEQGEIGNLEKVFEEVWKIL